MSRLLTCGFEENDGTGITLGEATAWKLANPDGGSTLTYDGTTKHSGTYALKAANSGTNGFAYVLKASNAAIAAGTTVYLRTYFRWASRPSGATYTNIMALCRETFDETEAIRVRMRDSGGTAILNLLDKTGNTDGSVALSADTWYRIELSVLINDSPNGTCECRLYNDSGTLLDTISRASVDTLPSYVQGMAVGCLSSRTGEEFYFDDVAWNSNVDPGDGSNMSWCGPGKIALIYPDTDTATIEWTPNTGTDHANNVDDVPGTPDDATTYNGDTQATNIDRLNVSALPAEVTSDADILLVDVYARVGNDSTTGTPSMLLYLWDEGGTLTPGPALSTDINGWRICATNEHLVYNAGTKTKANVNSFDIGYKGNTADGKNKWITALWANVEWIEAAAPTNKAGGLVNTTHCKSLVAGGLVG